MKSWILTFGTIFSLLCSTNALAQKFAYIDTEYILAAMPEYKAAQSEIEVLSKEWADEIDTKKKEIDALARSLAAEVVLLTELKKEQREKEIKQKEKELGELQQRRFGYDGDLFKKRTELIKPIQDRIYEACQKLCREKAYDFLFDKSGGLTVMFANPRFDKSDELLEIMGVAAQKK